MLLQNRNIFKTFTLIATALIFSISGCKDNTSGPTPPDFSTVPAPYDTTNAQKVTVNDGLVYYVIKEGSGIFEVHEKDRVRMFFTGRVKATGEIFDSTYKNDNTEAEVIPLTNVIEGLRLGMLGMEPGAKRKIIIPPEFGFQSTRPNLQGKTLIYDVKLVEILGD